MKFFVPLWTTTLDSSIWMEEDWVFKIWIAMLLLKDPDFIVRCTPFQIAQRARKTEKQVMEALIILSSPDTKRIEEQEYNGARIKAVDDGWMILNAEKYTQMMSAEMKKARNRRSQQAWRDRQKVKTAPLPGETSAVKAAEDGHLDPQTFEPKKPIESWDQREQEDNQEQITAQYPQPETPRVPSTFTRAKLSPPTPKASTTPPGPFPQI